MKLNRHNITPTGDQWRFWVPSDRPGVKPYLVDLAALDGNGQCDCPNFKFNLLKLVESGLSEVAIRCKHIKRARSAVMDQIIAASITGEKITR